MSTSSSISSSVTSTSYNRISGLASGLDTDSIVANLTKADKLKIQEATQKKIRLEWVQDSYKDTLQQLYNFQSKYFGDSMNSLLCSESFQKLSATYSSPYISVSPSSSSTAGNVYIADIVSVASAAKYSGAAGISASPSITVDPTKLANLSGKSFKVTLDGQAKTITFSNKTYSSADDVKTELSARLNEAFGAGKITLGGTGNDISLDAQQYSTVQINNSGITDSEASSVLGFTDGASNRVNLGSSVSSAALKTPVTGDFSFTINGKQFSFSSNSSFNTVMNAVNSSDAGVTMSYSKTTDSFTLVSKETGAASNVSFSDNSGSFLSSVLGSGTLTNGTDAVMRVSLSGATDGSDLVTVTRSTNSFDLDGTTYNILGKADGTTQEGISVKLGYSTDDLYNTIKSFVDDYNTLLGSITSKISEEVYSDYTPLTDDQKSQMSDSEVTLWEKKAKSGLLRNDSYLSTIASDMRTAMYSDVKTLTDSSKSIGTILAGIGITTGSYSEKGKLHIDEQKLKAAISSDPQKIITLFTQKPNSIYSSYASDADKQKRYNESGLLWKLSDIMSDNLSTVGKKGPLIELVGSPTSTYNTVTTYSKRISDMETTIEDLNTKLTNDEDKYYKEFTSMETAIQKLNSQSSWLSKLSSST